MYTGRHLYSECVSKSNMTCRRTKRSMDLSSQFRSYPRLSLHCGSTQSISWRRTRNWSPMTICWSLSPLLTDHTTSAISGRILRSETSTSFDQKVTRPTLITLISKRIPSAYLPSFTIKLVLIDASLSLWFSSISISCRHLPFSFPPEIASPLCIVSEEANAIGHPLLLEAHSSHCTKQLDFVGSTLWPDAA